MKTEYICTTYFQGIDGLGACDDKCQWWRKDGCVCAKGSKKWDGNEHYTEQQERIRAGCVTKSWVKKRACAIESMVLRANRNYGNIERRRYNHNPEIEQLIKRWLEEIGIEVGK